MIIKNHPLVQTLTGLSGNSRYCVYTEPLWGISYYLFAPFITIYQNRLGVSDLQIGTLISIGMALQMFFSLLSGPLTDKYGRRRITFIVDVLAWSIPCLMWAFARDYRWFLAAAVFSSTQAITQNSWQCLLVEDCPKDKLVYVFTWISICGLLAAFFAPISGFLVDRLSVVPVMRGLYLLAFTMMTAKFVILLIKSKETKLGLQRMSETKHRSLLSLIAGSRGTLKKMLTNRATLSALTIFILYNIATVTATNFFPLFVTRSLGVPERYVAYFPIIRSAVMLLFMFAFQHLLSRYSFRIPMLFGILLYIIATLSLVLPFGAPGLTRTLIYTALESFAFAIVSPRKDSLVAIFVDPNDRAGMMGLLFVLMQAVSAPFGWIAGKLSSINGSYPFYMNLAVFILFAAIVALTGKTLDKGTEALPEQTAAAQNA